MVSRPLLLRPPSLALLFLFALGCAGDEKIRPVGTASSTSGASTGGGGVGGTGGSGGMGGSGPSGPPLLAGASCDPLVPSQCGFPFPSDVYLVDGGSTASGKHVAFGPETLPAHHKVGHIDPSIVVDSDGFSPGQAPMTDLPGATTVGLPTQDDIDLSITSASPTILLDAESGDLVPHFAELDMNGNDGDRALMIRPVVRLKDGHRYIVAIRDVLDGAGVPIPPSPAFEALRDGAPSEEPSVDLRRSLYDDIFSKLTAAGIDRDTLQIAWDYTTATRENNTSKMVAMRDAALAAVGTAGPSYVIDTITDDPNPSIARRIEGHFTVPLYLDSPDPGGKLVLDSNGKPMQNGTADYPFIVQIPHAATTVPGAILQNGHGLLGSRNEGRDGYLATIAENGDFVTIAVDMIGMASDDEDTAVHAIVDDPLIFRPFVERQLQGMTNQLLAMRMMMGSFASDPAVQFNGQSAVDTSRHYYRGDSQGGIFGVTYVALSTDVTRGLLGEPGAPYNLLLNRSVDFQTFYLALSSQYASKRDVQIVLGLVQMLWDRIEPDGYLPYLTSGTELGAPPHSVLIHAALGDHQVTPLGAHVVARAVGAKALAPAARPIWGIDEAAGPFTGSGIVEYDYGALVPPLPETNTPTTAPDSTDPHDWVREQQTAIDQSAHFFFTGEIAPYCAGTCDPD